jgi:hypothetical protein
VLRKNLKYSFNDGCGLTVEFFSVDSNAHVRRFKECRLFVELSLKIGTVPEAAKNCFIKIWDSVSKVWDGVTKYPGSEAAYQFDLSLPPQACSPDSDR